LVLADVKRNLATIEGAKDYGVVIAEGAVDEGATQKLRDRMRKDRGNDIPTFNFGPSIDEIRASCKEETGLEAPTKPVFK
jgi:N-methylhydantoinase B